MTTKTAPVVHGPAPLAGSRARSLVLLAVSLGVLLVSAVTMFAGLGRGWVGASVVVMMVMLILMKVPIAFAMLAPSLLGIYSLSGFGAVQSTLTSLPVSELSKWTLSVIPMFILMGLFLWRAGLTESVYDGANKWLSWLPGGLALGTNMAGAGLAAVSGSTIGTTYALGRIGIPEMIKAGYDTRLALGSVMLAGLPGQLIPPSIMLVIYAGIAEVPVGPQLLAGVGPGVLIVLVSSVVILIVARKLIRPMGVAASATWGERWRSLARVWPVPILMAVIIFGMFFGFFTATETGSIAALLSLGVVLLWRRGRAGWHAVKEASLAAVSSLGAIFLVLLAVGALSRMLALTGVSVGFASWIESLSVDRVQFLLLMAVVYILLGTFMEPLAMMVLTIPVLLPVLETLDISLLWFGVFAVFMGELAILSPPVGLLSFVLYSICQDPQVNRGRKITMNQVYQVTWWIVPVGLIFVVLLILFPEIATWLPGLSAAP